MGERSKIQTFTNPSHNGLEIDINFLTGKNIEFKRSFALMLMIKNTYKNSMVYNYSAKSLSQKMNVSKYIIETYINRLIKSDYCHYQDKHLQFVSLNKIMPNRSKGIVINLSEKSNINSIVETFDILIIKNNFSKQDKVRTIKSDLIRANTKGAKINIRSYKKSLKIAKSHPEIIGGGFIDYNILGMRRIAQILGSSLDYAARFVNTLVQKKLISIKRVVKKYANFSLSQFSSDELKCFINKRAGYFYSFKDCTYHYLGTQIDFV